jgi:hypothetical protein
MGLYISTVFLNNFGAADFLTTFLDSVDSLLFQFFGTADPVPKIM